MKLLIIRHGDPDYSIDSLTETGWIEAELLSQRLAKMDIKAFYCSPLGRAKDTAAPTLKLMNREAEICPWLREFAAVVENPNPKHHTKCAWDWLPADWTGDPRAYDKDHWMEIPAFRDSNIAEEYNWVITELDALLARHGYRREGSCYRAEQANEDTIVLFCHYGLQCVLLSHLLNISPMQLWHGFCAAPTAVTIVATEERREGIAYFRANALGDTSHLYAAGREPSFSARFCETYTNWEQRHD